MKILTLDCETTTYESGNPFSTHNKLCYVGLRLHSGEYKDFSIEYDDSPFGGCLSSIQEIINDHDCIVGFNTKFDLHWLLRYGLNLDNKRFWDTQLVEFILENQSNPYPNLNSVSVKYGFSGKLDKVKLDYWDKGLDTTDVPVDILREYLRIDVEQTYNVFSVQFSLVESRGITRLISLANQDMFVLLNIEHNGMLYNTKQSKQDGDNLQGELNEIDSLLRSTVGVPEFNPGSNDHISACLYGGTLRFPYRETYIFTYKDGRTKERQRWSEASVTLPRLVEPLKGSALAKEGYFATNEPTLASLKAKGKAKDIIALIRRRSELEKRRGTYLHGLPALMEKKGWRENMIYGQLNQCVAITGRLSSSSPNLQNMDKTIANLFISRYPE